MSTWESTGIKYLKYVSICARALRNGLKDDLRANAQRLNENGPKFTKWEAGRLKEQKYITTPKLQ
ncbi:ATP synthase F1 subcomplex epsilon subunit ATP15 [Phycomyces blakesleeanus]|uniref:ATP synthase F1 subcomplex epsilon subunit ATP15 n=2 Tax=Phycomyces blakesleeanus TaxID=4837 RepID=A0A163AK34_PHYB8|nr:ATP synthase F1 subcomplex epsilon subunit ATP15 [Phycomyces blakesleeanus NRRL 1555(-)]OAD74021.1 ATP synthase F1 subcomplex epsilon subunit ATP15 [Phycomyces blakesleeanus NRRL 1555(-)]|eukprot:XP_018292061.1 ATP synthase F1 subcomplex epsilon subunit ATP15 [Phycomyces blakesleeanus NRRL 1555(-)]